MPRAAHFAHSALPARLPFLAPVLALLFVLQLPAPVAAVEPGAATSASTGAYAPDQVIVGWRDQAGAASVARAHGLEAGRSLGKGAGQASAPGLVKTNGRPVGQVLAELRRDPNVAYAEPDYVINIETDGVTQVSTNDPKLSEQYSLDRMRVRDAWSLTTGAGNVIAVLDTGAQFSHPDLAGRLLPGHDFVNNDSNPSDDNGHGTWVSGIIAARANDGYGIAGISWSDKILPVKIMNANGSGVTSNLVAGIRWAADNGAKVINMSIGGYPESTSVQAAVNYAWSKGVVLVGAAGNNRREETHFPASHDHVISVSATQADDEFTNWSSFGPKVDVSAPGGSVLTDNCTIAPCIHYDWGAFITISGTSFATPNTAGVVALLWAKYPGWTPQQIVDRLIGTVDDLGYGGWDKYYGFGRVNAYRALGGSPAAIAVTGSDGYESNNTLAKAKGIPLGTVVSPTNYPAGDVDYFSVDLPRAGRLDVRVTAVTDTSRPVKSALPVDPIVELLTTAGTRLALVDNASNSAASELASVTVGAATRVIVKVSNWFPNGSKVPYTLRATYVDTAPPTVTGWFPASAAAGLNRFVSPTVTFNESVTNVTSATVTLRNNATNQAVPATVSYDASARQARVAVTEQLGALTTYRLSVSGVTDIAGNAITPVSSVFTTGSYGYYDIGSSGFQSEIAWLAESGITVGCGAGRFCPTDAVSRQQMASFLVRALELPHVATDYFTDDAGSSHEGDINALAASGITKGCEAARYCPTVSVTREQMASFLVRALGLPHVATDYFSDDSGSSHQGDINALAAAGITSGCGPTTFCGGDPVTREQMAAFLERAFGS